MTFKASHYRKLEVLIRTDGINKTVSVDGVSRSTDCVISPAVMISFPEELHLSIRMGNYILVRL